MRFPLNNGQTKAVKIRPVLGGDAVGLPKTRRRSYGGPTVVLRWSYGSPTEVQRESHGPTLSQHRANTVAIPCSSARGIGTALKERIAEQADVLAFLFDQLGVDASRWTFR
jgi:hypothetical protein